MSVAREDAAERAWLRSDDIAPALLFTALAVYACLTPAQNDTWWHLRSGREMWETQSFLVTERFSYTAFGSELHNHWWLSQLAFFGVHAIGGPALLTVFAGLFAFAAVYGSWRLVQGPFEVRLVLLVFLILATTPEWAIRPQVISLALLVLMAHLIVNDRVRWFPLVCVVWANAHALVVFGVLVAGATAVEALVWSRHRFRRDLLIAALCAAAPVISPLGWEYWPRVVSTVAMSQILDLQEYRTPLEMRDIPFWLAAVALVGLTAIRWRSLGQRPRAERILIVASCFLALAAVSAGRNIAFFAVIAAPALSRLLRLPDPPPRHRAQGKLWPAYVAMTLGIVVAVTVVSFRWRNGGVLLGWRPISPSAIEALQRCQGPLFNRLEDGGYLMWVVPDRRVFIDSRMEAYPLELLRRSRRADVDGEYADLFRDYGITCALVATNSPLRERLARELSMNVTHADPDRTVFARSVASDGGSQRLPDRQ